MGSLTMLTKFSELEIGDSFVRIFGDETSNVKVFVKSTNSQAINEIQGTLKIPLNETVCKLKRANVEQPETTNAN